MSQKKKYRDGGIVRGNSVGIFKGSGFKSPTSIKRESRKRSRKEEKEEKEEEKE